MPVDLNDLVDTEALGKVTVATALDELVAPAFCAPKDWQSHAPEGTYNGFKPPVQYHPEIGRILNLPRREPIDFRGPKARALVQMMTARFANGSTAPCDCQAKFNRPCIKELRPEQAVALYEMRVAGGFAGSLAVGIGKTLLDILAPLAMPDCKVAVLLVPPKLIDPQLIANYEQIRNHFKVPALAIFGNSYYAPVDGAPMLYVLPYSLLSRHEFTEKLAQLKPDLIIADEVQNLRNPNSVRSGRLLWFMHHYPRTRYVCWSGSFSDKRIQDYCAHMAMALGPGSPLPQGEKGPEVLEDMSRAINPSDFPAPPGPLIALCPPQGTVPHLSGQRRLWYGYQKRLRETEGVVFTTEASISAKLEITERKAPKLPAAIAKHLRTLRDTWVRPDGEELVDALSVARVARELACGFYLYWYFPPIRGKQQETADILDWLDARKWWRKEVREELRKHIPHKDSPLLLTRAAMRHHGDLPIRDIVDVLDETGKKIGEQTSPDLPVWDSDCWPRWRDTRNTVVYESRCMRIDPFLTQDAADWAREKRGIVWYQSKALGQWIAELSGLPTFGGGQAKELHEELAKGAPTSIICSMIAHGTGTDGLQYHYDTVLVTQPPPSSEKWQQVIGRTHRPGQAAPQTNADVYRHTTEMANAVDEAISRATYVEGTLGSQHVLLDGNNLDDLPQAWDDDEGYGDTE